MAKSICRQGVRLYAKKRRFEPQYAAEAAVAARCIAKVDAKEASSSECGRVEVAIRVGVLWGVGRDQRHDASRAANAQSCFDIPSYDWVMGGMRAAKYEVRLAISQFMLDFRLGDLRRRRKDDLKPWTDAQQPPGRAECGQLAPEPACVAFVPDARAEKDPKPHGYRPQAQN
ncbi:MAG: hypothetical protein JNM59_09540 [Hyphomonadaceae bacterium]|nr:hypothetical protein [Hyphomonadaceae bacterium]